MNKWLACALVALTSGCPSIDVDEDETSPAPVVEFDPSNSIVPFPNNLLINPMTGKVNVPAGCNETAATKALREGVLNQLDGFGTFETAINVTLTHPLDPAQAMDPAFLAEHILLFKSTMDPATSNPIPIVVIPGSSIRYASQTRNDDGSLTCESPNPIDSLTIVPRVPLEQKSNYIVALTTGLKGVDDERGGSFDYVPSSTWALVRQAENPVTLDDNGNVVSDRTPLDPSSETGLASLKGIDLLWKAHNPVLQFLGAKGIDRSDVLLAWSFKTQTTTDALDPMVAGSPVTMLNDTPITGPADAVPAPISIPTVVEGLPGSRSTLPYAVCTTGVTGQAPPELNDTACFLKITLGGGKGCAQAANPQTACATTFVIGTQRCALFGCANVADVLAGRINSPQFQSNRPNPLASGGPIPGPFSDPVKPTKVEDEQLSALIFVPTGTAPAAGWPTAIFQHGLGQSNTNIFAIGGNLARDPDGAGAGTGIASIAIDAVAHGSRRVRISDQGDCASGGQATSCFAGFLSPDLGATRDNIRQTVIDHLQVAASLKKCTGMGATTCGTFRVDPAHIVYIGQSLGGIIGGITTAVSADVKASVLNVPGVGWADIFENTETLAIRCTLVDGLIDAGTLMGEKSNLAANPPTGLCTTDAWKMQPGYRQFAAIGRWVLDPADPANFIAKLAPKKTLIQEVVGDQVVPNIATRNEAALLGRMNGEAATNTTAIPNTPPPSPDVTEMPTTSKYIRYANVAPVAPNFPGNTYHHGSLLSPAPSVNATSPADQCTTSTPQFCDGVLGSVQMVVDAIFFLQVNK